MIHVAVVVDDGSRSKDLVVSFDDSTAGSELLDVVASRLGCDSTTRVVVERTWSPVEGSEPVATLRLRDGDRLLVGTAATGGPAQGSWVLQAVQGPAAGLRVPLRDGTAVLGRESDVDVVLADPAASRRHLRLLVNSGTLTAEDLGSTNGTLRNGEPLEGPTPIAAGDRLTVGDTTLVLNPADPVAGARHLTYAAGELRFNRPPPTLPPEPSVTIAFPTPPATPPKRRLPIASAVVPPILGIVIFLVMDNPLFLLFAGMGPVMAIWSWLDDRRSGRNDFRRDAASYREELRRLGNHLADAHERSGRWREQAQPPPEEVLAMTRCLSPELWSRRPAAPGFLEVRIGSLDQPSLASAEVPVEGDVELRSLAGEIAERFAQDSAAPLVISLRDLGIVGVAGTLNGVVTTGRWIVAQVAAHHSPREVAIVVLAPHHLDEWEWVKWLPHVRPFSSDGGTLVAGDDEQAASLVQAIRRLVDERTEAAETSIGTAGRFSPHLLLVLQPPLQIPRRVVTELLEQVQEVSMSVLWLDSDRRELPGESRGVVTLSQNSDAVSLDLAGTGMTFDNAQPDVLGAVEAEELARQLAPLRDIAAGTSQEGIPERVSLLDLLDLVDPTGDGVRERWHLPRRGLEAVVGALANGAAVVDLRSDGPHALLAGTTGAGKSELLQSLIASMAATHPPDRVTFLLVDYKGGAAFKDCVSLPHTVGLVTDLDGHLTYRALRSLEAELRRREHLLSETGSKDLLEMLERSPERAPASLVIVVDEFAALVAEVPDFVDGVVDIAQRGRSLGMHLILATQRPSGVIGPNIQANTDLRIALRVADRNDSTDVIGRPDAAEIAKALPGRGFMRKGPGQPVEFQAAYVGGHSARSQEPSGALAATFHLDPTLLRQAPRDEQTGPTDATDLQRLAAAARGAAELDQIPPPPRPWQPPLPDHIALSDLIDREDHEHPARASIGVADHPSQQRQSTCALDLEALGNLIVFGASGSGKTTALRTIAAGLASQADPGALHLYALDFAGGGLASLAALPHCGAVIPGDDIDRVRRLITILDTELRQRRATLTSVGASSPEEYRRATGSPLPAVIVLLDGFGQFWATMEPLDRSEHVETFGRIVSDGRAAGIHVVMSADRRQAVPPSLASTVSQRLILRMATRDEALSLGLPPALADGSALCPGRGFLMDGTEVQVATITDQEPADGTAQTAALAELGAALAEEYPDASVPRVELLPEVVARTELPAPRPGDLHIPLGFDELALEAVLVDLGDTPTFLVAGPDRSGRTTTLETLLHGLTAAVTDIEAHLIGTRPSALFDNAEWTSTARGPEEAQRLADELTESMVQDPRPRVLVVDDADELTDGTPAASIEKLLRRARDHRGLVLASLTTFRASRAYAGWVQLMRNARHGLLLQPDLELDGEIFQTKLPRRAGLALPAGRGYLVGRSGVRLIQVAS